MARPVKDGLDYFPLDCNMDDNVRLVEAEFGVKGFAVVIKLYQKIYGDKGYFTTWDDDVRLLFADSLRLSDNLVSEVVNRCITRGIFDQLLYDKYGILTSRGIQERYYEVAKRRNKRKLVAKYILFDALKNLDNVDNNQDNANSNRKNASDNAQSKVNKSKKYIIDAFETLKGSVLSPHDIDNIMSLMDTYDNELMQYAIDYAMDKKGVGQSVNYVDGILRNWSKTGITTKSQAIAYTQKNKVKSHTSKAGRLTAEDW